MINPPTPHALAAFYSASFIRERIARILENVRNPSPACLADKRARAAARREAAKAIGIYRAALRIRSN